MSPCGALAARIRPAGCSPISETPRRTSKPSETEREVFFLVHNGGLKLQPYQAKNTVDSEVALRIIAENGGLEDAIPELKKMSKALNLLLLRIDRESRKAELKCLNYWTDRSRDAYYQFYAKSLEGGKAIFSSTLDDGNGRVGRLLLINILLKHKLPPVNIELRNRREYYAVLRRYEEDGKIRPTIEFLLKEYKRLKSIIEG